MGLPTDSGQYAHCEKHDVYYSRREKSQPNLFPEFFKDVGLDCPACQRDALLIVLQGRELPPHNTTLMQGSEDLSKV